MECSRPPFRSGLVLGLAILLAFPALSAAECDNCPQRRIGLYDFDVTVPRPDSLSGLFDWYPLFYGASGAGAAIFTPQCAQFLDGSVYRDSSGVPSNSLKVGIDVPYTPPAGNLKGMDYLLNGKVAPDGSGFKVTLSLECACDRSTVVTASSHFDRADQASTVSRDLAARTLVPVAQTIRDFEKALRDKDPEVSIGGFDAKLVVDPSRRKVDLHETVPITFTLTDCDGEPLAGRKILLAGGGESAAPPPSNGTFAAAEATTGSDGKVTVDFTVGGTRGVAMARAYFVHKTPAGCKAVAADEAAIEVGGTSEFYHVRYKYRQTRRWDSRFDEERGPSWNIATRSSRSRQLEFSGSTILRNIAFAQSGDVIELEGPGEGDGPLVGILRETIRTTGREDFSDKNSTIRTRNYENRTVEGGPYRDEEEMLDFYAWLDPDELGETSQFSMTVPFSSAGRLEAAGSQSIRATGFSLDSSWTNDDDLFEETSYSPSEMMTQRYSLKDSVFHVDAVLDTSWTTTDPHVENHLQGFFSATIAPVAKRLVPDGVFPAAPRRRLDGDRVRFLDRGASISIRLDDIDPATRVRVDLHSLSGERLDRLHDAPRATTKELVLALGSRRGGRRNETCIVVFRAGGVQSSHILTRTGR